MGCKRIEIDVQKAAGLAQRGLTDEKIARSLGISPKTFQRRKGEKSELSAALEKARADVEASLGDRILKLAKSDDAPPKVQLEACKYFLTMRCGWTQAEAERETKAKEKEPWIPKIITVTVPPEPDSPDMEQLQKEWQYRYEVEHGLPVTEPWRGNFIDHRREAAAETEDIPAVMPEIRPVVG